MLCFCSGFFGGNSSLRPFLTGSIVVAVAWQGHVHKLQQPDFARRADVEVLGAFPHEALAKSRRTAGNAVGRGRPQAAFGYRLSAWNHEDQEAPQRTRRGVEGDDDGRQAKVNGRDQREQRDQQSKP